MIQYQINRIWIICVIFFRYLQHPLMKFATKTNYVLFMMLEKTQSQSRLIFLINSIQRPYRGKIHFLSLWFKYFLYLKDNDTEFIQTTHFPARWNQYHGYLQSMRVFMFWLSRFIMIVLVYTNQIEAIIRRNIIIKHFQISIEQYCVAW